MNNLPHFIRSHLDEDNHQDFTGVANALCHNAPLRKNLTLIACMASFIPASQTDPTDNPLLPQTYESAMTSAEMIGREIVTDTIGREKVAEYAEKGTAELLQNEISKSLTALGIEKTKIQSLISMFPSDITLTGYINQMKNCHLIKGFAFSTFNALKTFVLSADVIPGTRKKQLTMTPEYLMSLINANSELLNDEGKLKTRKLLERYIKACKTEEVDTSNARMNLIRKHCVANISHYLSRPNMSQESLCKYAQRETYPVRTISDPSLSILLKTVPLKNGGSKEDTLIPQCFNCFLCEGHQETTPTEMANSKFDFHPKMF